MNNMFTEEHITNIGMSGWLVAILTLFVTCIIIPLIIYICRLFKNRKSAKRSDLYKKLKPIWDRNYQIFLNYGPHEDNDSFYDLDGNATDEWRIKVSKIIIPNHERIRKICNDNLQYMNSQEIELFHIYEDHVADFLSRHQSNSLSTRIFPSAVIYIFKD